MDGVVQLLHFSQPAKSGGGEGYVHRNGRQIEQTDARPRNHSEAGHKDQSREPSRLDHTAVYVSSHFMTTGSPISIHRTW